MLGLDDVSLEHLQPQAQQDRLAALLHHAHETDLAGHRIRNVDLEGGRYRGGRLPQSVADLRGLDVLDEPRIRREGNATRIVGHERGQVVIDQPVIAGADLAADQVLRLRQLRANRHGDDQQRRQQVLPMHREFPLFSKMVRAALRSAAAPGPDPGPNAAFSPAAAVR